VPNPRTDVVDFSPGSRGARGKGRRHLAADSQSERPNFFVPWLDGLGLVERLVELRASRVPAPIRLDPLITIDGALSRTPSTSRRIGVSKCPLASHVSLYVAPSGHRSDD
jgi:hypothetical protein